jgi:hypothetical protein
LLANNNFYEPVILTEYKMTLFLLIVFLLRRKSEDSPVQNGGFAVLIPRLFSPSFEGKKY